MLSRFFGFLALLAFILPFPAAARDMPIHCWCQQESTHACNHIEKTYDAPLSVILPYSKENRATTCAACGTYCAGLANGPWHNTRCESGYREEICAECTADASNPLATCTEAMGARMNFTNTTAVADAQRQALISQCQSQQTQPIFPIHLGTAIGGIDQVNGLAEYINVAYRYMVSIVLVVAIVMTVYGGFRYLFGASMGSVQAGKDIIRDALVGMLLVLGAYTILSTVNPATTILGLNPPEAIRCQDLQLPAVVSRTQCSTDTDCTGGLRCVEGHNIAFSVSANLETFREGDAAGAAAGQSLADAITAAEQSFVGDGHGADTGFAPLDALMNGYLTGEAAIRSTVLTTAGRVAGGDLAGAGDAFFQMRSSIANLHLCSNGEQGSPCTLDRYCTGELSCAPGWELCWPSSGNGPGMPCSENRNCTSGLCEAVGGSEYHVCQVVVRDSTPCFRHGGTGSVYPTACGGTDISSDFVCAWCPSGSGGEARNWSLLAPGLVFPGQCKPPGVLGTDCTGR